MTPADAALAFVSLLVIVDPVALAPVFAALTAGMAPAAARRTALVGAVAGTALIGAAGLGAHWALRAMGAETRAVHLAVAAALAGLGLAMLLGRGLDGLAGRRRRDPALAPLAFPLVAGPGAMGAMAMLAGKHAGHPGALAVLYALLAAVGAVTYAAFRLAGPITRRLGPRGARLVTRALGLVLIAAAARFFLEALARPA